MVSTQLPWNPIFVQLSPEPSLFLRECGIHDLFFIHLLAMYYINIYRHSCFLEVHDFPPFPCVLPVLHHFNPVVIRSQTLILLLLSEWILKLEWIGLWLLLDRLFLRLLLLTSQTAIEVRIQLSYI